MADFHQTGYGRKFFEADLPNLIKAINRVGDQLEKFNDNLEGFALDNIKVEGEALEPFIRKVITEQVYFENEIKGVNQRGE